MKTKRLLYGSLSLAMVILAAFLLLLELGGGVLAEGEVHPLPVFALESAAPHEPLTALTLTAPLTGMAEYPVALTATVAPPTATLPVSYTWTATGQGAVFHGNGGISDTLAWTWNEPGWVTVTVAAANPGGAIVSATRAVTIETAPCLPLDAVTIRGFEQGVTATAQLFTAQVQPSLAGKPVTYTWSATEQNPLQHVGERRDTISFTWQTTGTKQISVTAVNACSAPVTAVFTVTIKDALRVYLPAVLRNWPEIDACKPIEGVSYESLFVVVDPGHPNGPSPDAEHDAGFNMGLLGYWPVDAYQGFTYYSPPSDRPPQFRYLFADPQQEPVFSDVYELDDDNPYNWDVTLLGVAFTPEATVHVPDSGYDIQYGYDAMVLYASEERIALNYTREDNLYGYTVYINGICTEPSLLALYEQLDAAGRHDLPVVRGGQPIGRAWGEEIRVALRDTGTIMDPRSYHDWWAPISR